LSLAAQPVFYAVAPHLARRFRGAPPPRQAFRDEWRYWLTPWKQNENSAERFCQAVCEDVEPNAVVLLDSTSLSSLQVYLLTTQRREDVSVMSPGQFRSLKDNAPSKYREWIEQRPIYIRPVPSDSDKDTKNVFGSATFLPVSNGLLYRVEPTRP